jgi:hypothetical protein
MEEKKAISKIVVKKRGHCGRNCSVLSEHLKLYTKHLFTTKSNNLLIVLLTTRFGVCNSVFRSSLLSDHITIPYIIHIIIIIIIIIIISGSTSLTGTSRH